VKKLLFVFLSFCIIVHFTKSLKFIYSVHFLSTISYQPAMGAKVRETCCPWTNRLCLSLRVSPGTKSAVLSALKPVRHFAEQQHTHTCTQTSYTYHTKASRIKNHANPDTDDANGVRVRVRVRSMIFPFL